MNEDLLIRECRKGSRRALEELVERYYYPLLKFFSKYDLSRQICEDLTHDTILKMIENIERYRAYSGTKFSTWLFTIAYNTLLNYINKFSNKQESGSLADMENILPAVQNTEEEAIRNIDYKAIKHKVDSLSIEDRTLINLRYIHGFGYKEISQVMNMHEKTVKWKLHDAIERLRKLFEKEAGENELSKV